MRQIYRLRSRPRTLLGRQWSEWLEGYPVGKERLDLSLDFASSGAASNLVVDGSALEAELMGSLPEPYRVVWTFAPVAAGQWEMLRSLMTAEAWRDFRKGIVGTVMESALAASEIPLLPTRYRDLRPSCTCSEWLKPCQHALAVLRLLGQMIEDEPMLLLRLRGAEPQEALPPVVETGEEALRASESEFWGSGKDWGDFRARLLTTAEPARLLSRLGPFTVYGMKTEPEAIFRPVYEGVAAEVKVALDALRKKENE